MSDLVRTIHKTDKAPAPIGPFSQAVQVGSTLYLSGSVGSDSVTGQLVEGGIEAEARLVFKNIGAVLEQAGCSFNNVVACQVLLADFRVILQL